MTKTFSLESGDYRISVECVVARTKNGFKHIATCYPVCNDVPDAKFTCTKYYLNRTWEMFEFQSVLLDCVNRMIDNEYDCIKYQYMRVNGYKRLSSARRTALQENLNHWYKYTDLVALKDTIIKGVM